MCDAIHTARRVDGLPVLVELAQYPAEYDGRHGDEFAARLSEVASAIAAYNGGTMVDEILHLDRLVSEMRRALDAAGYGRKRDYPDHLRQVRAIALRVAASAVVLAGQLDKRGIVR